MAIRIVGILRAKMFSHRAVEADRAILEEALTQLEIKLEQKGTFKLITEESLPHQSFDELKPDFVLTMAQGVDSLFLLHQWEKRGVSIINCTESIHNCFRENLISKMIGHINFPFVKSELLATQNLGISAIGHWIKRADFHATDDQDVIYIEDGKTLEKTRGNFLERGIDKVVKQPHLDGTVFKFYGVGNKIIDFRNMGHSGHFRYALPPDPEEEKVSLELWKKIEISLAPIVKCLALVAYGGDIIISSEQNYQFIDINDWPSFRTCRPLAAKLIAEHSLSCLATPPIWEDKNQGANYGICPGF